MSRVEMQNTLKNIQASKNEKKYLLLNVKCLTERVIVTPSFPSCSLSRIFMGQDKMSDAAKFQYLKSYL